MRSAGRLLESARTLLLRSSRSASQQTNSSVAATKLAGPSMRHALLISGIGLSVFALAQGDGTSCSTLAQCDARYTPAYSGEANDKSGFTLPLDHEQFETFDATKSRVQRFSCASYKANAPIEDRFAVQTTARGDVLAAVFDGHGGWQVAEYISKLLLPTIEVELASAFATQDAAKATASASNEQQAAAAASSATIAAAMQRAFGRTDRALMAAVLPAFQLGFGAVGRCGACALVTLVHDDVLHVANAGDIRAVMGTIDPLDNNKLIAVPLSNDQNAMVHAEQEKLVREHPNEPNAFTCRHPESCYVKGALQPTRAFGDFSLKYSEFNGPAYKNGDRSAGRHFRAPFSPPYITAQPEIQSFNLAKASDKFVIIGSDGLWDYLSNDEAVEVVKEAVAHGKTDQAARALVERTLQNAAKRYDITYADLLSLPPGSHRRRRHDDTTVIVLFLE